MTTKRFEYKNHKVKDNLTGEEHSSNMVSVNVLNALHEELKYERRINHNNKALIVDELRGLFQGYLTQCYSLSEEAIVTMIQNDVKKIIYEVFNE